MVCVYRRGCSREREGGAEEHGAEQEAKKLSFPEMAALIKLPSPENLLLFITI